jgi:hypothetical protein
MLTDTNLAIGQHTTQFRATDSTALQGPSVSFTWQVTPIGPPPDSSCVSSKTGRIIMGINGGDMLIGNAGSDIINGKEGNDGINGCNGADIINGGGGDVNQASIRRQQIVKIINIIQSLQILYFYDVSNKVHLYLCTNSIRITLSLIHWTIIRLHLHVIEFGYKLCWTRGY